MNTKKRGENPLGLSHENKNRRVYYTQSSFDRKVEEVIDFLTSKTSLSIASFIVVSLIILMLYREDNKVDNMVDEARISRKLDVLSGKYDTKIKKAVRVVEIEPTGSNESSRVADKGPN